MQKFIRHNFVNTLLSGLLLLGFTLVIFSPELMFFKWIATYVVHIMFFYLFLGLLFLWLGQKRLMFFSLLGTACLAVFLKTMTNTSMKPAVKNESFPSVKVAHFNVNNSNENFLSTIQIIDSVKADLISVHEITPLWDSLLMENLSDTYPYHFAYPDLGLFGMAIFSKLPLADVDTIRYKEIPNVIGAIALDENTKLNFISSHTLPSLNYSYYERLKEHLAVIARYVNKTDEPILALGDYHTVPWSNEIAEFRNKTGLLDSRRGFTPTFPHGVSTVFEVPVDHIFYSDDLECLSFSTVSSIYTNHLGIQGTFQLKPKKNEDAATAD